MSINGIDFCGPRSVGQGQVRPVVPGLVRLMGAERFVEMDRSALPYTNLRVLAFYDGGRSFWWLGSCSLDAGSYLLGSSCGLCCMKATLLVSGSHTSVVWGGSDGLVSACVATKLYRDCRRLKISCTGEVLSRQWQARFGLFTRDTGLGLPRRGTV